MNDAEFRIAYLRPAQILARLRACNLAYVPVGPLEWHGEHLPYGVDAFNADEVARAACAETGGVVWPTLFWGTERERQPQVLRNLGLGDDQYIVGMDFPGLSLPSAYCSEECFAMVVRETLRQAAHLGAKRVAIINGHGAVNHNRTLQRLATEISQTTDLKVRVRVAFPVADVSAGSIGHAAGDETSLLMHYHPQTVDLSQLAPLPEPLRYQDTAIVDGVGFDGRGNAEHTVLDDPRTTASAERGALLFDRTVGEVVSEIRTWFVQNSVTHP